ncbi:MAG: YlxR family protein [Bifidobacteriaceae bacterium]|jgi:predicted RNA-binding protein YlxR (DUF448 family)|nr:YlxR family protein [Bifidobacteriaceae bacterium]
MASNPRRTCLGCRQRDTRTNLVRLALDRETNPPRVILDPKANRPGRGAWLHRCKECADQAIRRGNWARAFRLKGAVTAFEADDLSRFDHTNPSEAGGKSDGHTMSALK